MFKLSTLNQNVIMLVLDASIWWSIFATSIMRRLTSLQ